MQEVIETTGRAIAITAWAQSLPLCQVPTHDFIGSKALKCHRDAGAELSGTFHNEEQSKDGSWRVIN